MEPFIQTTSIARRLRLTILTISTFFILEFVGIYISSRDFLDSTATLRTIITANDSISKTKQIITSLKDILNQPTVTNSLPENSHIYEVTKTQADRLLFETLNLTAYNDHIHILILQAQESVKQMLDRPSENRTLASELKVKSLVTEQIYLEAIETLNKATLALTADSTSIFNHLYEIRFRPILISIGLAILFLSFALWSGLHISKQLKTSVQSLLDTIELVSQGKLNLRATIIAPDEIGSLTHSFNNMTKSLEESTVSKHHLENANLALANANKELESFSYSVSHDLRAPLRAVDGFSQALLEDYSEKFDEEGKRYLNRIRVATQRMGNLIDDILKLSRISRTDMNVQDLNLSEIVQSVVNELMEQQTVPRKINFKIKEGIVAKADSVLIRIVFDNLINNALKYTSKHATAEIEFGMLENSPESPDEKVYFVKDDGAGFDMNYAGKLFGAFQRLHRDTDFPGNGIGLATVQRIIHRHHGNMWAEGAVEKGATFFFTLNSY